jgi:hypothetical protein
VVDLVMNSSNSTEPSVAERENLSLFSCRQEREGDREREGETEREREGEREREERSQRVRRSQEDGQEYLGLD